MGQHELRQNLRVLRDLCGSMGLMDHYHDLEMVVQDECHCRDSMSAGNALYRSEGLFVNRKWLHEQIKRLGRGPNPEYHLFE